MPIFLAYLAEFQILGINMRRIGEHWFLWLLIFAFSGVLSYSLLEMMYGKDKTTPSNPESQSRINFVEKGLVTADSSPNQHAVVQALTSNEFGKAQEVFSLTQGDCSPSNRAEFQI